MTPDNVSEANENLIDLGDDESPLFVNAVQISSTLLNEPGYDKKLPTSSKK
jgi:hypothetical protein